MPDSGFLPDVMLDPILRFVIDFVSVFILVRLIYYPRHRNKDFLFTFFLFNLLNFLICYLLARSGLQLGFAFGLFVIFSIMRYRTVVVPIKEMGFFFIAVALGIINALATSDNSYAVPLACNTFVLLLTFTLDRFSFTHENMKEIVYERIDLIKPALRAEMIADLKDRTGLPIHKVEVRSIDFLKDVAIIHAYFFSKESELQSAGAVDDGD
jgi:hypothetical protein